MGESIFRGAPMTERFSDREKTCPSQQPSLEERLKEYPELKTKMEAMLGIIENAGCGEGGRSRAADLGGIAAHGQRGFAQLGRRQQQKKEEEYQRKPGMNRKGKKVSTGTRGWEPSS